MRAPCRTDCPTPPQPMIATVEPGLIWRGVEGGADAGGDAAADERELFRRQVGVDLHAHRLFDLHLLGEGAEAGHPADLGAVRPGALHVHAGRAHALAELGLVVQAEEAVAARGDERGDDPVTRLHAGDLGADREHRAGALVPEDQWRAHRHLALVGGDVGVADAARVDVQTHARGPEIREGDLLDHQRLVVRLQDGSPHRSLLLMGRSPLAGDTRLAVARSFSWVARPSCHG